MADLRLDTSRLTLLLPQPTAAARVRDYFHQNREHHGPSSPPWTGEQDTEAHWQGRLAQGRKDFEAGWTVRLFLFHRDQVDGPVLGTCNLTEMTVGEGADAQLGYGLEQTLVGRGLMTEAVRAMLHYAFAERGLEQIRANHLPENDRSARLLRGLGFLPDPGAGPRVFVGGAWREHLATRLRSPGR